MICNLDTCKIPEQELLDAIGLSPLQYWNLSLAACENCPETELCQIFFDEYTWQSQFSRQNFRRFAVECAEAMKNLIGTFPYRNQVRNERLQYDTYHQAKGRRDECEPFIFQTNCTHVQSFGVIEQEIIAEDVMLTYQDMNDDGINETVTVTTTILDLTNSELNSLVFKESDTDNCLTPTSIELDGAALTVMFDWWEMVSEIQYTKPNLTENFVLNACDEDIYIDSIDIYKCIKAPCIPDATVYYPADGGDCYDGCELVAYPACVIPIDLCRGTFRIRLQTWGEDEEGNPCPVNGKPCPPCVEPYYIEVNYVAGVSCNPILTDAWGKLIASKFLVGEDCRCSCTQASLGYYATDMFMGTTAYPIPPDWKTGLGITRGAILAYNAIAGYNIPC